MNRFCNLITSFCCRVPLRVGRLRIFGSGWSEELGGGGLLPDWIMEGPLHHVRERVTFFFYLGEGFVGSCPVKI